MKGIDVSENNGVVDWQAVADAGIGFVIVRASYGKNGKDEMFQQNVEAAHAVGLQVGAYHYSYALTPEDAILEATNCHAVIEESGAGLELPVFFDMEDADGWKANHGFDFSAENVTAICHAFLDDIGLEAGKKVSRLGSAYEEYSEEGDILNYNTQFKIITHLKLSIVIQDITFFTILFICRT